MLHRHSTMIKTKELPLFNFEIISWISYLVIRSFYSILFSSVAALVEIRERRSRWPCRKVLSFAFKDQTLNYTTLAWKTKSNTTSWKKTKEQRFGWNNVRLGPRRPVFQVWLYHQLVLWTWASLSWAHWLLTSLPAPEFNARGWCCWKSKI